MYPAVWSSSTNVQIFGVPTLVVANTESGTAVALAIIVGSPTAVVALSPDTGTVLNVAVVITPITTSEFAFITGAPNCPSPSSSSGIDTFASPSILTLTEPTVPDKLGRIAITLPPTPRPDIKAETC